MYNVQYYLGVVSLVHGYVSSSVDLSYFDVCFYICLTDVTYIKCYHTCSAWLVTYDIPCIVLHHGCQLLDEVTTCT